MTIQTSGLPAGDAVTAWWVVFNSPQNCDGPSPGHPFQCGPSDLFKAGNPAGASMLFATGHVVGSDGAAGFGAHLQVGDTGGALFGPGLVHPRTAHIHVVLRDHGPADPSRLDEQLHSFNVCNATCSNVQAAVFEQ
jgi:hypothetical protein